MCEDMKVCSRAAAEDQGCVSEITRRWPSPTFSRLLSPPLSHLHLFSSLSHTRRPCHHGRSRSHRVHQTYVLPLRHRARAFSLTDRPNGILVLDMHFSARRNALSKFTMPAMSPTMTEGGIASWKFKEGDSFAAGDVLLEIVRPPALPIRYTPAHSPHDRKLTRQLSTSRRRTTASSQKSSCVHLLFSTLNI